MNITQVSIIPKPEKKLLYKHLKTNDTFMMHGDKDVRIRTKNGHIGFHERDYYSDGLKVSLYENDKKTFDETVVKLITLELQWCEKGDS